MKIHCLKYAALFSILGFSGLSALPARAGSALNAERSDQLALQLFLDAENFGPGRVDGKWGEFTGKALRRWNEANANLSVEIGDGGPASGTGTKLWGEGKPVLREYTLDEKDLKLIGDLPEEPEGKAKLNFLPYASALELVSEKFHADHDFVRELNPGLEWESLAAGTVITVPNVVTPFELSAIEGVEQATSASGEKNRGDGEATPGSESAAAERNVRADISLSGEIIEVREGETLIGTFPISVGAQGNETPAGDWKVNVIQWMPEFRYDEQMLEQGERSDDFLMLPPGPNSPVGIVWIGLDADGIGLHGTDNAHDIGRNKSSGCIRLSNWDARKLGELLEVGASVNVTK